MMNRRGTASYTYTRKKVSFQGIFMGELMTVETDKPINLFTSFQMEAIFWETQSKQIMECSSMRLLRISMKVSGVMINHMAMANNNLPKEFMRELSREG